MNAFLEANAQRVHMQTPPLRHAKIAQLDAPRVPVNLIYSAWGVQEVLFCTRLSVLCDALKELFLCTPTAASHVIQHARPALVIEVISVSHASLQGSAWAHHV